MKKILCLGMTLGFALTVHAYPASTITFKELTPQEQTLSPEEQAYLERAMAQPLTFMVKPEDSKRLWGMAQAFIAKYAGIKIQTVSDYVIETYNPDYIRCAYRVILLPKKNGDEFSIACLWFLRDIADRNAHIFAHYLMTEEIVERLIIGQPTASRDEEVKYLLHLKELIKARRPR